MVSGCFVWGLFKIAKEKQEMTSKSHQKKMIKKRKERAHKANRKADQKRIERNHAVIFGKQ
jgi:hypothetical protein